MLTFIARLRRRKTACSHVIASYAWAASLLAIDDVGGGVGLYWRCVQEPVA
jgi:hypothetical protein